jgi:hypothetical protein
MVPMSGQILARRDMASQYSRLVATHFRQQGKRLIRTGSPGELSAPLHCGRSFLCAQGRTVQHRSKRPGDVGRGFGVEVHAGVSQHFW